MCSEGEVMAAALPSHFKLSSETQLVFNEEYGENFDQLDHDEYIVGEALLLKKELKMGEVQQLLDSSHVYPVIKRLIDKKVCFVWEALKETYTPKKETFVLLNPIYDNEDELAKLLNEDKKLQRAEKQTGALAELPAPHKNRRGSIQTPATQKKQCYRCSTEGAG